MDPAPPSIDNTTAIALQGFGLLAVANGQAWPTKAGRAAFTRHQLRSNPPEPPTAPEPEPYDVDVEWLRKMAKDEDSVAVITGEPVPSFLGERYRAIARRLVDQLTPHPRPEGDHP